MATTAMRANNQTRCVLGGCELIGLIGKGATGSVFKARQLSMDRIVAVKVLLPELGADRNYVDCFLREARAAAKLSHPNIIRAIDVGESQGRYYFVMEYAQGITVDRLVREHGGLAEGFCLDVAAQMARAIQAAEKLGMVHLDIKPGNIIMTRDKVAKLADFGLARRSVDQATTSEPEIFGTPEYVSPEQALRNRDLDSRSDIYSLGATLYKMLSGERPFKGKSPREIVDARFFYDPTPLQQLRPALSPETCAIVNKMMARDRSERYQNASELLQDLEFVIALRAGAPAAPVRPKDEFSTDQIYAVLCAPAVPRRARRKFALGSVLAMAFLIAIGVATFLLVRNSDLRGKVCKELNIGGMSITMEKTGKDK